MHSYYFHKETIVAANVAIEYVQMDVLFSKYETVTKYCIRSYLIKLTPYTLS